MIDFRTSPDHYKHWKLSFDGPVATLAMDVDENGGIRPGYELKLNSYDLAVDIELYDAVQRLRFEHPQISTVILTSAKERVFCAGANIKMLGLAEHSFKVNFCKFTNETRNAIEDASANSGQFYIAAINGPCAGGGYELALAADYIVMVDDGITSVSLPELPLLAVLPGTGGLTRLVDKRRVRSDRADFFCTTEEGIRGKRALEWRLVDEVVPRSRLHETVMSKAAEYSHRSARPSNAQGLILRPLERRADNNRLVYRNVKVEFDRERAAAHIIVRGPQTAPAPEVIALQRLDDSFWPLALARELDDAVLHLRFNEEQISTWVFHTEGDGKLVEDYDRLLVANPDNWLIREIVHYLKRVFKRLEVSSRSLFALIEPGSCFTGTLLELVLAADRAYMLNGIREEQEEQPAQIRLTEMNFGPLPKCNGLARLENRFLSEPAQLDKLKLLVTHDLDAETAAELGLVGFIPDEIDWDDEVRLAIETRAAFSSDALTGLEASLRFAGPETLETKIFARLSAWQNWIFQRPNAVGENGALKLYGTGKRPIFDPRRV
ncbi:MAG: benzoyl-CoA-dihydrodiol lyase [Deltaproteobacteria bacterium]|nr:benzoyl-CoA-dihydrodiol lyase [Deltaproteobacteria bacterium]